MKDLQKILAIIGPTASGKSALSERLAQRFHGEVLAADSRVVYRGMDIGTAKIPGDRVPAGEYEGATMYHGIPHWLQDLADPDEPFTVAEWKREVLAVIPKILGRKHLPMLVGGTGLYVQALVDNYEPPAIAPDARLRGILETKPLPELVTMLRERDPEAADRVDARNPRRVIRALEVAIVSGAPLAAQRRKGEPLFETLQIALDVPRKELYARIDRRVDEQVRDGLFEEVGRLVEKYGPELPALSAIGYRQVIGHLQGKRTKSEAIERIKFDSHAYARRQLTWFRRDMRVRWVKTDEEAEALVREWLQE